jgi:hypothetical protein
MGENTKFLFCKSRGNLEARSCNDQLKSEGYHTTIEIVQWDEETIDKCWTIAFFKKEIADHSLIFVGERPFDERVSILDFWNLAKLSSELLKQLK